MLEKMMLSLMVAAWFAATAAFVAYEPDRAILFARVFVATCLGIARTIGVPA